MAAADVWSLSRQREREQELLFVGEQYRQAIERYFLGAPPGIARALPSRLEDLLEDDRYPVPVHHLRRLYVDPVTGGSEWGLLQVQGRIAGVHSLSEKAPIKQAGFDADHEHFTARSAYRDWVFAASVPGLPLMTKPSPGGHAPEPGAPTEPPRPVHRTPP
jgi:type II secretory pathway pseudopilin PulG